LDHLGAAVHFKPLCNKADLRQVPLLGDKATAKDAAKALGLKTWRYVKI